MTHKSIGLGIVLALMLPVARQLQSVASQPPSAGGSSTITSIASKDDEAATQSSQSSRNSGDRNDGTTLDVPSNDLCTSRIILTCTSCVVPYDTSQAQTDGVAISGQQVYRDVWFKYTVPQPGGCTSGRVVLSNIAACFNSKIQLLRLSNCATECTGLATTNGGTFVPLRLDSGPPVVNVGPFVYGRSATTCSPAQCFMVRVGGLTENDFGPGLLRIDFICNLPQSGFAWSTNTGRCCFADGSCMVTPFNQNSGATPTCCASLGGYLRNTTDFYEGEIPPNGAAEIASVGCETLPCPAQGEACFNAWDLNGLLSGTGGFGTVTRATRNRIYFKWQVPVGTPVGSGITIDACSSTGPVSFDAAMAVYRGFNLTTGECHQLDLTSGGPGNQACTNTPYNNAELARDNDCGQYDIGAFAARGLVSCYAAGETNPCLCLTVVATNPNPGQIPLDQPVWIGLGIKNTLNGSSRPFTDPVRADSCGADSTFSIHVASAPSCFSCAVTCPGGSTPEGEGDLCNNSIDQYDGGCNALFPYMRFHPIASGQTYCGTSGTYRTNGSCVDLSYLCAGQDRCVNGVCVGPGDNMKDYDFYRIQLTQPQRITWTVNATFPVVAQIVESPDDKCSTAATLASAINFGDCTSTVAAADACAGYIYLSVAPAIDNGVGCGRLYYATLNCSLPSTVNCCPGDVNNDGRIDGADIRAWLDQFAAPVGLSDAALSPIGGCFSARTCSADFTGDFVVDLADLPGFVANLLGGNSCPATSCGAVPACHPVSASDSAIISDIGLAFGAPMRCADDFKVADGQSLTKLCWWGFYFNFDQAIPCAPTAGDSADDFQVTVYSDTSGLPGTVLVGPFAPNNLIKTDTGADLNYQSRPARRFQYEADLPNPVPVSTGGCYWLEIANRSTAHCVWLWETSALGGNGVCVEKANGSAGATNWQSSDVAANDFAFCLPGLRIDQSDCGLPPGRCCVYQSGGTTGTCSIQTQHICEQALGGHWQMSTDCSTPCPVQGIGGCPGSPSQSIGPDLIVGDISGPLNEAANGTLAVIAFGATACNLGDHEAMWDACPANTHPVFGGNVYKWYTSGGATRFEQIGQSWLKNGFGADRAPDCCVNCIPSGNEARLGIGCSDAYVEQQFASYALSPKYLVNAHTGYYPTGCTIHPSNQPSGQVEMESAELTATNGGATAAVRLFAQFQYVTADDALAHNQNNNASSREMAVSGSGTAWTFSFVAATQPEIPAICVWKTIDSNVVETDVSTPEDDGFPGLVIMAAKATDLGTGFWRYEYAVNNLNSDRSIGSFSVPCPAGATVQSIGFHDLDYHGGDGVGNVNYDGTNWPGAFSGGSVSWATTPFATNQNANAIRWGTLYNFRFDANRAPTTGNVTLGEFKVVTNVTASTVVPSSP